MKRSTNMEYTKYTWFCRIIQDVTTHVETIINQVQNKFLKNACLEVVDFLITQGIRDVPVNSVKKQMHDNNFAVLTVIFLSYKLSC